MKAKHPTLEGGGEIESCEAVEGEQREFLPKSTSSRGSNKTISGIPAKSSVDFGSPRQSVQLEMGGHRQIMCCVHLCVIRVCARCITRIFFALSSLSNMAKNLVTGVVLKALVSCRIRTSRCSGFRMEKWQSKVEKRWHPNSLSLSQAKCPATANCRPPSFIHFACSPRLCLRVSFALLINTEH